MVTLGKKLILKMYTIKKGIYQVEVRNHDVKIHLKMHKHH